MQARALTALGRRDEAQQVLAGVRARLEPRRGTEDPAVFRVLGALDALDAPPGTGAQHD